MRRLFFILLGVVIALLATSVFQVQHPSVDDVVATFLRKHRIPGAVVAVGVAGRAPEVRAYGLADAATHRPMRTDLRFRIASLSKPITAAAILALVHENRITLRDKLITILPEAGEALDQRYGAVTVRDLLQHSGGWDTAESFDPFFLDADEAITRLNIADAENCRSVAHAMLSQALQFNPGQRYGYSNLGYCWLALIIERVYGAGYEQAVRELVLSRIGAASMQVGEEGLAEIERVRHHTRDDEDGDRWPFLRLSVLSSTGGWVATAEDYFRFASRPIDPAILSPPHFAQGPNYYGLGWRVWPSNRGSILTHFGSMPGVFSFVMRDKDDRIVVALFNALPRDDRRAFEWLRAAFERALKQ